MKTLMLLRWATRTAQFAREFAFGLCLAGIAAASGQGQQTGAIPLSGTKQLFIDDHVIESIEGMTRTLHRLERYSGNPVLIGTEPWEQNNVSVNGRPVLYDEDKREFRMWYMCGGDWPANYSGNKSDQKELYKIGYATSKDGIHWVRPDLGQVVWEGDAHTNILQWGETWMRRVNIIHEPGDPNPERRYKMIYADLIAGPPEPHPTTSYQGHIVTAKAFSTDGIHWRLNVDGKPLYPRYNENLLGWDPHIQAYVLFGKRIDGSELEQLGIGRRESKDFLNWSEFKTVLQPMPEEPLKAQYGKVRFNGMETFLYEDIYLGWLWFEVQTPDNKAPSGHRGADVGAELIVSRDGIEWKRPFPGQFIIAAGSPGSWDERAVRVVAPVFHDGKAWVYYGGCNYPHLQAGKDGFKETEAIGLATLPLDRFVSLDATSAGGHVTTRLLQLPPGSLRVNANVRGELRVEVLGVDDKALPGYTAAECVPITSDDPNQLVRWKKHSDVQALGAGAVRLRFVGRKAELFAFWVDAQQTGAGKSGK